jgi:hypothetical protein
MATRDGADLPGNQVDQALGSGSADTDPINGADLPGNQVEQALGSGDADGNALPGVNLLGLGFHTAVTPTAPTAISSFVRRAGTEALKLIAMAGDPPAETNRVLLYVRTIAGVQTLFARLPDGSIFQVGAG